MECASAASLKVKETFSVALERSVMALTVGKSWGHHLDVSETSLRSHTTDLIV